MATNTTKKIRIDSGILRGRHIHFDAKQAIRPSKALVKKTLFNWLRSQLQRATCIDMFAGSGSLGFEAASQGAKQVVFLDKETPTVATINKNITRLRDAVSHCTLQAATWSYPDQVPSNFEGQYDVVFLDPPFCQLTSEAVLAWLQTQQLTHSDSLIYLEMKKTQKWPENEAFYTYKHAHSGGVQFGLMRPLVKEK